ncbi:unnamed protein product [Phaeothamnion confervicola]
MGQIQRRCGTGAARGGRHCRCTSGSFHLSLRPTAALLIRGFGPEIDAPRTVSAAVSCSPRRVSSSLSVRSPAAGPPLHSMPIYLRYRPQAEAAAAAALRGHLTTTLGGLSADADAVLEFLDAVRGGPAVVAARREQTQRALAASDAVDALVNRFRAATEKTTTAATEKTAAAAAASASGGAAAAGSKSAAASGDCAAVGAKGATASGDVAAASGDDYFGAAEGAGDGVAPGGGVAGSGVNHASSAAVARLDAAASGGAVVCDGCDSAAAEGSVISVLMTGRSGIGVITGAASSGGSRGGDVSGGGPFAPQ